MRGTRRAHIVIVGLLGIIPAYAGNTWLDCERWSANWDHPRVCGEHATNLRPNGRYQGSSPRMRGTLDGVSGDRRVQGIIPAYAGNTSVQERRPVEGGDHPRVCGEHIYPLSVRNGWQGSSPRMRGTPRLPRPVERGTGIIPAPFGSTGSSPRMRGTLLLANIRPLEYGIIPAYAGNTST